MTTASPPPRRLLRFPTSVALARQAGRLASAPSAVPGASSGARHALRQLGRWGFLTALQARRLLGAPADTALLELRACGWLATARLSPHRDATAVYHLTAAGMRALAGLCDPPSLTRPDFGRMHEQVAAVDLALVLHEREVGEWRTWAEYCANPAVPLGARFHRVLAAVAPAGRASGAPPPDGVLIGRASRPVPAWILLQPGSVNALRRRMLTTTIRLEAPTAYAAALPDLCSQLLLTGLPAIVEPWTPPHLLHGRGLVAPTPPHAAVRRRTLDAAALQTLGYLEVHAVATGREIARARGRSVIGQHHILHGLQRLGLVQRHRAAVDGAALWSRSRSTPR